MIPPREIKTEEYNYDLPESRIAKFPLNNRDESKLLFYNKGNISGKIFHELPSLLDKNYELVFNDTKVIQARLIFEKITGSAIEIFLLEPFEPSDYALSFASVNECKWNCLVGNLKKWKSGPLFKKLTVNGNPLTLNATRIQKNDNSFVIQFTWDNDSLHFSEIVSHAGLTPIPPYLNREAQEEDVERYQTVYSNYEGSVAAPTAGLHFTENLLKKIHASGIKTHNLTLHVGAGTFIPVKEEDARKHIMHTEQIFLNRDTIEKLYYSDKKFLPVGTTSVRTLESLYWTGVKLIYKKPIERGLFLDQWEVYNYPGSLSRKESMLKILEYLDKQKLSILHLPTRIMIVPGYDFKMTDGIITNFHQPKSTLLLLIAAYTENDWKRIYNYALENSFRFLSYGDSSLLLK